MGTELRGAISRRLSLYFSPSLPPSLPLCSPSTNSILNSTLLKPGAGRRPLSVRHLRCGDGVRHAGERLSLSLSVCSQLTLSIYQACRRKTQADTLRCWHTSNTLQGNISPSLPLSLPLPLPPSLCLPSTSTISLFALLN